MKTIKIEVSQAECEKCGFKWIPHVENPWKCPRCQHVPGTGIKKKASVATRQDDTPAIANSACKGETAANG